VSIDRTPDQVANDLLEWWAAVAWLWFRRGLFCLEFWRPKVSQLFRQLFPFISLTESKVGCKLLFEYEEGESDEHDEDGFWPDVEEAAAEDKESSAPPEILAGSAPPEGSAPAATFAFEEGSDGPFMDAAFVLPQQHQHKELEAQLEAELKAASGASVQATSDPGAEHPPGVDSQLPEKLTPIRDFEALTASQFLNKLGLIGFVQNANHSQLIATFKLLEPFMRAFIREIRIQENVLSKAMLTQPQKEARATDILSHELAKAAHSKLLSGFNRSRFELWAPWSERIVASVASASSASGSSESSPSAVACRISHVRPSSSLVASSTQRNYQVVVCRESADGEIGLAVVMDVFRGSLGKGQKAPQDESSNRILGSTWQLRS
jgi:hypothetical protein